MESDLDGVPSLVSYLRMILSPKTDDTATNNRFSLGDGMDLFMAAMVVKTCSRIDGGLPPAVYSRMITNIILDFLVGLVPFLGDIADALYRCNTRNVVLLEQHLREKGAKASQLRPDAQTRVDPSLPEEFDRSSDEEIGDPPRYDSLQHGPSRARTVEPTRPEPVPVRADAGRGWRWFRTRQADVERDGIN